MDSEDEKKFDTLESNELGSEDLSGELGDIKNLDKWMKSLPLKNVGIDFTATVVASAMLAQKRHSNFKLLVWMIAFFAILTIGSYWVLSGESSSIGPVFFDKAFDGIGSAFDVFSDPRTRQLFLVVEGVLCLVVLEKIVSSFRMIKKGLHHPA